jgi:hypothetical protein
VAVLAHRCAARGTVRRRGRRDSAGEAAGRRGQGGGGGGLGSRRLKEGLTGGPHLSAGGREGEGTWADGD